MSNEPENECNERTLIRKSAKRIEKAPPPSKDRYRFSLEKARSPLAEIINPMTNAHPIYGIVGLAIYRLTLPSFLLAMLWIVRG